MTDTQNRVLTFAEVLALEEGRRVWVEERKKSRKNRSCFRSMIHTRRKDHLVDYKGRFYDLSQPDWCMLLDDCVVSRVWSLPQPPTQEEMEKWPWEESK